MICHQCMLCTQGKRSRDILLWCLKDDDQPGKKRAATTDPKEQRPKDKKAKDLSHYKASISEVEETIDQLKKIHGSLVGDITIVTALSRSH